MNRVSAVRKKTLGNDDVKSLVSKVENARCRAALIMAAGQSHSWHDRRSSLSDHIESDDPLALTGAQHDHADFAPGGRSGVCQPVFRSLPTHCACLPPVRPCLLGRGGATPDRQYCSIGEAGAQRFSIMLNEKDVPTRQQSWRSCRVAAHDTYTGSRSQPAAMIADGGLSGRRSGCCPAGTPERYQRAHRLNVRC